MVELVIFNELVSSLDFILLVERSLNLVNPYIGLGNYIQGLPIPDVVDFTWGTNSGIRSLPVALFYSSFALILGKGWEYWCLATLPTASFILSLWAFRYLSRDHLAAMLSSILYSFNGFVLYRFHSGFWQLNLVYSFLPLIIVIPVSINSRSRLALRVYAWSLLVALTLCAQPHFMVITGMFLIIWFALGIIWKSATENAAILKFYFSSFLVTVIMLAFVIVPSLVYRESVITNQPLIFSVNAVEAIGSHLSLIKVLTLNSSPHFSHNMVFEFPILLLSFVLTAVCLKLLAGKWAGFVSRDKKLLLICLLTALGACVFLAKGLNPPLVTLSRLLYSEVSLLHAFRDPSRFFSGVALYSSLLFALFRWNKKLLVLLFCSVLVYSVGQVNRFINQSFFEQIQATSLPRDYKLMKDYLDGVASYQERLLVVPDDGNFKNYSWYGAQSAPATSIVWFSVLPVRLPLANSNYYGDSAANQFSAYLTSEALKSKDLSKLEVLGVGYVLLDENYSSGTLNQWKELLVDDENLQLIFKVGNLKLFKMMGGVSLVSGAKPVFAIGDFKTLSDYQSYLKERPMILLNQKGNCSSEIAKLDLHGHQLVIDRRFDITDLVMERVPEKYLIDLSDSKALNPMFVNYEPYKIRHVINSGTIFTSNNSVNAFMTSGEFTVIKSVEKSDYVLSIKYLEEGEDNTVRVALGDGNLVDLNIKKTGSLTWTRGVPVKVEENVKWVKFIKSDKTNLVIDKVVLVPREEYEKIDSQTRDQLSRMELVTDGFKLSKHDTNIDYNIGVDRVSVPRGSDVVSYKFAYGSGWVSDKPSVKLLSNGFGMSFMGTTDSKIFSLSYPGSLGYRILLLISLVAVFFFFPLAVVYRRWKKCLYAKGEKSYRVS